jgi:hypothetical protein
MAMDLETLAEEFSLMSPAPLNTTLSWAGRSSPGRTPKKVR